MQELIHQKPTKLKLVLNSGTVPVYIQALTEKQLKWCYHMKVEVKNSNTDLWFFPQHVSLHH